MSRRVAMRDHRAERVLFNSRAVISLGVVILMVIALISNLHSIQLVDYQDYQTRSNNNRIRVLPVAPNRGLIYDRNGILLADNRPVFTLEIVPEETDNLKQTVTRLAGLLNIETEVQQTFLERARFKRRFKHLALKESLSEQEVALFAVNQHQFPGVYVNAHLKRHYPYKEVLTHVLGYVAKINTQDLQMLDERGDSANYKATRDIGKRGLERYYEEILHGKAGFQRVEVNNRGRVQRIVEFQPPVPGQDLHLSLDLGLQLLAMQELAGRRGAAIALDARDGSVLALVSSPSYDPNLFVHGISSKDYQALLNSPDRPLINRTTQGIYPPASTIKPLIGLLALEEGVVHPSTRIWDPGWFQLPNVSRKWRDWKRWGHGWVDIYKAIAESCDTYYYDIAVKLGIDKISAFMEKFGFGDYSGIDIGEEYAANMPSREWKRRRHNQPWYHGDTVSIGIGQSYWTTTPIQLAHATSILARKGENFTPQLVRAFGTQSGRLATLPDQRPPVTIKHPANWDVVLEGMRRVNHGSGGSARKAFADLGYESGGKSGTAQVFSLAEDEKYDATKLASRLHDNAMFVAFAPFNAPEIVVAIALENAGGGSSNAAPIARKLLDYYMQQRTDKPQPLNLLPLNGAAFDVSP